MVQRVTTVAFEGIEIRPVDVQVQVAPGMPAFTIVACPTRRYPRRASGCARP
jgi:magnesium chelatase family protein